MHASCTRVIAASFAALFINYRGRILTEAYTMSAVNNNTPKTCLRKGVTYDVGTGDVISCLFCRIATREEPGTIVYEDENIVAFKNIAPASDDHLLITPRKHIQNLSSLSGPKDAALVREMKRVGKLCLGDSGDAAVYLFHGPPWNSIDHLHLHAISHPEKMNFINMLKYSPSSFWCKTADAEILRLQSGRDRPPPGTITHNHKNGRCPHFCAGELDDSSDNDRGDNDPNKTSMVANPAGDDDKDIKSRL